MHPRVLRFFVAWSMALCAWLVASEAFAGTATCEDRGYFVSVPVPLALPSLGSTLLDADAEPAVSRTGDDDRAANDDADAATYGDDDLGVSLAFGVSNAAAEAKRAAEAASATECGESDEPLVTTKAGAFTNVGAPMCGHHGVSVNAPAPFLETPQALASIGSSSVASDESCSTWRSTVTRGSNVFHRGMPHVDAGPSQPVCDLPTTLTVLPLARPSVSRDVYAGRFRAGVQHSLDRPPRG